MSDYNYGTYGSSTKSFGGVIPIWKYIASEGIEEAGGKLKVASSFATEYPAGTIIPTGTPVNLAEPGGDLTILKTFEADVDFDSSTSTKVVFKAAGTALPPVVGEFYMLAPATAATTGTGYEVANVTVDASGNYSMDISTGTWGAASEEDIFVQCDKSGAGAVLKVIPTGLLRREVYIPANATSATGASVFHGTILGDRIPPVPACVKAVLPMIKFEKG